MYFITLNSSNFDDLLTVNIMIDKDLKQGMLYCYILL